MVHDTSLHQIFWALPWKICFPCIFFLTKNYCLCGFFLGYDYVEVYSVVKILGNFSLQIILWSQLWQEDQVLGKNKYSRMYLTNCSSKTFLEFT